MGILVYVCAALIAFGICCLILYVIIRAAVKSALADAHRGTSHLTQLLAAQAELTARLAKHLIAQTDLMVLTARHDGVAEADLEPVLAQVAERKAEPAPRLGLPFA